MHNKCMGLYGNLAISTIAFTFIHSFIYTSIHLFKKDSDRVINSQVFSSCLHCHKVSLHTNHYFLAKGRGHGRTRGSFWGTSRISWCRGCYRWLPYFYQRSTILPRESSQWKRAWWHSLNLQAVCGHDLEFIDCCAGWSGDCPWWETFEELSSVYRGHCWP